ncbi:hypothetical protein DFH07DRAFT_776860 [Mycena maculata]|uniref:Secreted protein n=1 Tax=Mycena maculata TaxID=230809 RepID=A0AAD7N481_9AGAR|nr:hypothetical protein DFH07DRAFT_776860 [Mycena maculata]
MAAFVRAALWLLLWPPLPLVPPRPHQWTSSFVPTATTDFAPASSPCVPHMQSHPCNTALCECALIAAFTITANVSIMHLWHCVVNGIESAEGCERGPSPAPLNGGGAGDEHQIDE